MCCMHIGKTWQTWIPTACTYLLASLSVLKYAKNNAIHARPYAAYMYCMPIHVYVFNTFKHRRIWSFMYQFICLCCFAPIYILTKTLEPRGKIQTCSRLCLIRAAPNQWYTGRSWEKRVAKYSKNHEFPLLVAIYNVTIIYLYCTLPMVGNTLVSWTSCSHKQHGSTRRSQLEPPYLLVSSPLK